MERKRERETQTGTNEEEEELCKDMYHVRNKIIPICRLNNETDIII